jgi:signal transduction histidine kinase
MRRGAKPRKVTTDAERSVARKPSKQKASGRRELERRLAEVLDQQTATAEILRVISRTPTEVQPAFTAILDSAIRLCDGHFGGVYRFDGQLLHQVATRNLSDGAQALLNAWYPSPPGGLAGLAIRDKCVIHSDDFANDPRVVYRDRVREFARLSGAKAMALAPMLRDEVPIGVIVVTRRRAGFTESQLALFRTFADQAVIAIENVRLFTELQTSNRELTTALDTQTATSDILRVISQSQTDIQPVFEAIVGSAARLLGAHRCTVTRLVGGQMVLAAFLRTDSADDAVQSARFPMSLDSAEDHAQVARARAPLNVTDAHTDPRLPEAQQASARVRDYRSLAVVPMLRHDEVVGTLGVARRDPGGFTDDEIALLQTFSDQAVIAIENARLLSELQASNRELEVKSHQVETASQHKSEFLANMSHELRTPLNAIIGFSEVLVDRMFGELNDKQEEYLKDIYASGQHLLSLINDILDLSKIEAGRMELEVSDFDLPGAIDNALILVRERASRRGITLGHDVDERLGQIRGDERKVKQVLLNLLSNALKFTPEGGRIDVSARVQDGVAEVSVADTGVGIAPEDQEAVFEEFRQVGTADKKVEGTGLGLALSRKFIELHGGRIWVESELGKGSTFIFTLPLRREPDDRGKTPTLIS